MPGFFALLSGNDEASYGIKTQIEGEIDLDLLVPIFVEMILSEKKKIDTARYWLNDQKTKHMFYLSCNRKQK